MVAVFFHDECLSYRAPPGVFDSLPSPYLGLQIEQPEGPERILNTRSVLEKSELTGDLEWFEPGPATDEQLLMFHTREYLDRLIEGEKEAHYFTTSTYMVEGGMSVIRLSAGCALEAAKYVISGRGPVAYAVSRPPGHHAQPGEADGYCFINGLGLMAQEALNNGYQRIAVIDWDVHHGNGTQAGFYNRSDVLTISLHMNHGSWGPTHIQTGDVDEIGEGEGRGYNVNLPLPLGAGDAAYRLVFDRCVAPVVRDYSPDLILIANGQDANQFDPNGRQSLTMAGYHALGGRVRDMAGDLCDGKVVMTQEGGYNPTYAPYCAYAVMAGLLGREMEIDDPIALYPDDQERAERDVSELIARHPLL